MSIDPIITFKAGACDLDDSSRPYKVSPKPTPGYIYLYKEDDLPHFCWRPRSAPLSEPTLDLIMFPGDGSFKPYEPNTSGPNSRPVTNGRIFALRFSSSSSRHLFWLQSKTQHPAGDPSWFSPRDLKLGQIVDKLLQGEEVDVQHEISNLANDRGRDREDDDDETMEDAEGLGFGPDSQHTASGGAGADATGGDIREEGEGAREGGADGGRAAAPGSADAQAAVANFLRSLQGNTALHDQQESNAPKLFTTLPDLLQTSTTLPIIDSAGEDYIDELLSNVPPTLLLLMQEADDMSSVDASPETAKAAIEALSMGQKKSILHGVLRSPQFTQSLGSLTVALRDGGLPSICDALKIKVENGGFVRKGGVPIGGGEAVEAFINAIKASVEEEAKQTGDRMDTR